MQIISYKNELINFITFFQSSINNDNINGISVSIIRTKDNQIVVFDDNMGNDISTEVLQNSTITDLQETTIFTLENMLNSLTTTTNFQKRIILNIYPLIAPILSNETIQYVNEQNKLYITQIKTIINKYPNLNISLSSINTNLLQEMKRQITNNSLGLIINTENPVYVEADFYILKPIMLDEIILKQELDSGNEVMISITNANDLSIIYSFFKENSTPLRNELLLKLTFMTGYPQVLSNLLK